MDPDGGWGAAMAHYFQRRADVLNRGHSGYNTRLGLQVLPDILAALQGHDVALATLLWGANDAALPDRAGARQHVPLEEYRRNMRAMVELLRQTGVRNILLISPPPVDNAGRSRHQQQKLETDEPQLPERTLEAVQPYAEAVGQLAAEAGLPWLDLCTELQSTQGWQQLYLKDGLHFTPDGARAVWALLQPAIETAFPSLTPDAMPSHYPWWDKVNAGDPAATFGPLLLQQQKQQPVKAAADQPQPATAVADGQQAAAQ